jgi:hypothetical protein
MPVDFDVLDNDDVGNPPGSFGYFSIASFPGDCQGLSADPGTGRIVGAPQYPSAVECEFEYTLVNTEGTSRAARVVIWTTSGVPPRVPQAADDFATTVVGQTVTFDIFANDDLGEPSALSPSIFTPGGLLEWSTDAGPP